MLALLRTNRFHRPRSAGFTLIELMVTLVIFALVAVTVTLVLQNSAKSKQRTTSRIESEQSARAALDLMARDIRTAGYGADRDAGTPQPAIAYIDSNEIIMSINQLPFPDAGATPNPPLAYNPASVPRPRPLDGTAYAPPVRYSTGAELIRYTLDVNNDGAVNASDVTAPEGADAASTPNPNDFVLVRQVYGDETGGVAGDNGGTTERVALLRRTGSGVPPIFNVYFRGLTQPWDWSNGPVPSSRLNDIQRIEVQVTAAASRPDAKGNYAQTTLKSQVNASRSVPDFGANTYVVSGYVFNDNVSANRTKDAGEAGIPGATVRLGNLVAYTNASGYYQMNAKSGNYTIRHTPAMGYGSAMSPDTFAVLVANAGFTKDFADTARAGGMVHVTAFDDADADGTRDAGEAAMQGIRVNISPGTPETQYGITDASGQVALFTGVGGYDVTCVPPDSFAVTTGNPQSGTMTNGGSDSKEFGLTKQATGTISGKVYVDANRNGSLDGSEVGVADVWVGATKDGGTNILGYANTDASGNYRITVPTNDPPRTTAFTVYTVPPAGYFPTGSTAISGIWVRQAVDTPNNNFGMANFQIIRLTANRVLSLAAADVVEADWTGKRTSEARKDQDLLLGADAGATDNVSVWFNNYSASPLFGATPTKPDGYSRLAPNSVMSMAVDTLDKLDNHGRPDLVTGTKYAVNGNFFVWFNQGSSNNEGYLPATYSPGKNYLTQDNGDVQATLTMDVGGGDMPDIIVGTKSPIAGQGSVEVWLSDDATTPTFTRDEVYNSIYSTLLGEVNSMTLSDMDNDGDKDLLIATRTSDYNGQMIVYENRGRTAGNRFVYRYAVSFGGLTPTAVSCLDADGDGWQDIFVGTQRSTSQGRIYQFKNTGLTSGLFTYGIVRGIDAPGIVTTMTPAELGANTSRTDLAVGYRTSTTGYGGGVVIYYMDLGLIPSTGVDPSQGSVVNMVPALASANFNYGLNTTAPPSPFLTDLAAGVKASATTGALVVFIR
jgi:prepilin-type N-terminal cleavage/methylation domain-containing protein